VIGDARKKVMENFSEKISALQHQSDALFYNSSGDVLAYKLRLKHLSSAVFLGYALQIGTSIVIRKPIYLIDMQKKSITYVEKGTIELVPLT